MGDSHACQLDDSIRKWIYDIFHSFTRSSKMWKVWCFFNSYLDVDDLHDRNKCAAKQIYYFPRSTENVQREKKYSTNHFFLLSTQIFISNLLTLWTRIFHFRFSFIFSHWSSEQTSHKTREKERGKRWKWKLSWTAASSFHSTSKHITSSSSLLTLRNFI